MGPSAEDYVGDGGVRRRRLGRLGVVTPPLVDVTAGRGRVVPVHVDVVHVKAGPRKDGQGLGPPLWSEDRTHGQPAGETPVVPPPLSPVFQTTVDRNPHGSYVLD